MVLLAVEMLPKPRFRTMTKLNSMSGGEIPAALAAAAAAALAPWAALAAAAAAPPPLALAAAAACSIFR